MQLSATGANGVIGATGAMGATGQLVLSHSHCPITIIGIGVMAVFV